MTTQSSDDQQLRNIARDVRFLTYKAGAPHPLARWLFLSMLAPLLLIFAAGFLVELAIQFNVFAPRHQPSQTANQITAKGKSK